jgi:hypothetical protein
MKVCMIKHGSVQVSLTEVKGTGELVSLTDLDAKRMAEMGIVDIVAEAPAAPLVSEPAKVEAPPKAESPKAEEPKADDDVVGELELPKKPVGGKGR